MDAVTFVTRQHARLREQVALLEGERYVRASLLRATVSEIVSFLTIEEDLLYPVVAPDVPSVVDELATVQGAVLSLLAAKSEADFSAKLQLLASALLGHAETDAQLLTAARARVSPQALEELGERMARFYRDGAAAETLARAEGAGAGDFDVTFH